MGTLTNTEMQLELKRNLGNRSAVEFDTDRLQLILNQAQVRLARANPSGWDELEDTQTLATAYTATPADDKYLAIPTGTRRIHSLRLIDDEFSRKLIWRHPRDWDKFIPEPEHWSTDRPTHYTKYLDKFEFWRVPNAVYELTLRRSIWPTRLTTGTQTSDFTEKDDMLILLATVLAWTTLGKEERAMNFWTIYRSMLGDVLPDANTEPDSTIRGFPGPDRTTATGEYWADPFIRDVLP